MPAPTDERLYTTRRALIGTTDIGNISYASPVGVFGWPSLPMDVSLHTWPVTACAGMSISDKASTDAASIMAGAGYDFMTNPALRTGARADLNRRRGNLVHTSPLPAGRVKPDDMLTPLSGQCRLLQGDLDFPTHRSHIRVEQSETADVYPDRVHPQSGDT